MAEMEQSFCEVESADPSQQKRWMEKHGFAPDESGNFAVDAFEGKDPVTVEKLFENIRVNVLSGDYTPLYTEPYDERAFVMVCGGPSVADHLDEIRAKVARPEEYLVVCSNMTGGYLLSHGITPHVHFILDPQEKKKRDVAPGNTSPDTQYWINVASDPSVFAELREQGIKPYAFLADFESEGKARQAVKESMAPGQPGMMAIQGGTMAGLRAMNLADALGFRAMEYYGFDATVRVENGKAQPYAYEKKRGEVIIEVTCDQCGEPFDTTLILQKQVNEFLDWSRKLPWMDVRIIGGGLIAHCQSHAKEREAKKWHSSLRFTQEYAELQKQLHTQGGYGVAGAAFIPTIFHGISQLAKRLGAVTVLDYGSAGGNTMKAVREHLWLPPSVEDRCYDPFVDAYSEEPGPADFVICTDVMEHVEPECTKAVLDHIQRLTKRIVFFSISLCKARKVLADGRNAHINIRDAEFWLNEISRRFVMSEAKVSKDGDVLLAIAQSVNDVKQRVRERKELERAGRRAA